MFEKIVSKKNYMKIVEQILNLIENDGLKLGDKLPSEISLANEFNASRSSVREAMSVLESFGFIERKGGKGSIIVLDKKSMDFFENSKNILTEKSVLELMEARKIIETGVAYLAALNATENDINNIRISLEGMEKNYFSNKEKRIKYDREFHLNIATATKNKILHLMVAQINNLIDELLKKYSLILFWDQFNKEEYFKQHEEILNELKNKKQKECAKKMRDHLNYIEQIFINKVNKR